MAKEMYCVVGAGIVGSATALALSNCVENVILLDQFPLPHSRGSSHGQSRTVRHSYGQDIYATMMPESYKIWHEIEELVGENLLVEVGLLTIDSKPLEGVAVMEKVLNKVGVLPEVLNYEQITSRYPMLAYTKENGAIFEKEGAIARADKCLAAIQKLFVRNGGKIYEQNKVMSIDPGNPIVVKTLHETLSVKKLILTAGPWAKELTMPLGLNLPLRTEVVSVFYWKVNDDRYDYSRGFPMFADICSGPKQCSLYGFPCFEYPGLIKVCGHHGLPALPDDRDKVDPRDDIKIVSDYVSKHLIRVSTEPSIIEKCMYTCTPDNDFIIDKHPKYKDIIIGAGFSGHGFKMAPVVGKILAEIAVGKEPSYDITPFRLSRFQ